MSKLAAYRAACSSAAADQRATAFAAAWEQLESAYMVRLLAALEEGGEWPARFRLGVELTMRLVEEHPEEAHFLAVEAERMGELGRHHRRRLVGRLTALLDEARAEVDDPDGVPAATATWILGILFDRIFRHLVREDERDLAAQAPELCFLAVSAYFGVEAGVRELA